MEDPKGLALLTVCRAILDHAHGRAAPGDAARFRASAERRLVEAAIDPERPSFDVDIALKLLRRSASRG